jgi:hypothetical protein
MSRSALIELVKTAPIIVSKELSSIKPDYPTEVPTKLVTLVEEKDIAKLPCM